MTSTDALLRVKLERKKIPKKIRVEFSTPSKVIRIVVVEFSHLEHSFESSKNLSWFQIRQFLPWISFFVVTV